MKKYIFSILLVGIIKLFDISFFTNDINICKYLSGFASNIYSYDNTVASEKIYVYDYIINEDSITISSLKNEVILPINGIVSEVGKDYIEIQASNDIYTIYNIDPSYRLYQYYKSQMVLGKASKYIVKCKNISTISAHLVIDYEQV